MEKKCSICLSDTSGGSRGSARGARPPLFLYKTEARRAEKSFFGDRAPSLSKGLDDRLPRPSPPYLKVWNHHWTQLCDSNNGCLVNVKENSGGIPSCILQWKEMLHWKLECRFCLLKQETRWRMRQARVIRNRDFSIFFSLDSHIRALYLSATSLFVFQSSLRIL